MPLRRFAVILFAALLLVSTVSFIPVNQVAAKSGYAVSTGDTTNVTADGATLHGSLSGLGEADGATVYVVYWKDGRKDTTRTWWTGDTRSTAGTFAASVSLEAGTTYQYQAYAKSTSGTWKAGSVREVTTPGRNLGVDTLAASDVTAQAATLGGNVTGFSGADRATGYVKYWPKERPSEAYWHATSNLTAASEFTSTVDVTPDTTYEYRALIHADGEWQKGAVRSFTSPASGFAVSTAEPAAVGTTSVTVGGNVTSLGSADSATVYVRYWRANGDGGNAYWWTGASRSSAGEFQTSLANLRAGTEYWFRAYVKSGDGRWAAGTTRSFTTEGAAFEVSAPLPENVTDDSARVGAVLHGLGGSDSATVYVRYWESDRKNETLRWWTGPTVSETGTYETVIDGLRSEEEYTVQALARSADGRWVDSRVKTFRTEPTPTSGEPPVAAFDRFLISESDAFENARPFDANDTMTFNATGAHDPDGDIVSYEWDFDGDHETDATGEVVQHSFPSAGEYSVRLTVTDDDGVSRSTEGTIHVGSYRADTVAAVNVGGQHLYEGRGPGAYGHPNWQADTTENPYEGSNYGASGSRVLEADSLISFNDVAQPPIAPYTMYETVREDPATGERMQYSIPAHAGQSYEVRVYFSEVELNETTYEADGPRTFDVVVEGQTLVDDFDTYDTYGHDAGGGRTITVTPQDESIDVTFSREQGDPVVSGIEVLRVDGNESGS